MKKPIIFLLVLSCITGLLLQVSGQGLQPGFLASYNSSQNRYSPVYAYQLPDSSYRVLCLERENGWIASAAKLIRLDKYGRFINVSSIDVPGLGGDGINREDVCSDQAGNLYFRLKSDFPQNPGYPSAFVKFNIVNDTFTDVSLQKAGVVQTTFLSSMQDGRLVSYYSNPSDSAQGKSFEIINPALQGFPVDRVFPYLPLSQFYQVLEYDAARFIFTDFQNDSFVLYKTDTGGNVLTQKRFVVYPPGSTVHTPGTMQLLKRDGNLFFLYGRFLPAVSAYQPYLCKMDMNLQVQWDKPVGDTLKTGSRFLMAPISGGRFLMSYTRNIYSVNPYLGSGGVYFSYLDANGDSYNGFNISTRPYGWIINDSIGSIAWFELVSMTQTLDKGILVTCNVGADDVSYKGAYTVFKTDSNGTFYLNAPPPFTSTGKAPATQQAKAYPNPFSLALTIECSGTEREGELTITSVDGQYVFKGHVKDRATIATTGWRNGIYLYTIQGKQSIIQGKLVKF